MGILNLITLLILTLDSGFFNLKERLRFYRETNTLKPQGQGSRANGFCCGYRGTAAKPNFP